MAVYPMCFHNQSKPELLYLYTSEALTEARSMNSVHLQQARSRALSVHLLICLPAAPPSGPFPAVVFRRPFRKASPLSIGHGVNHEKQNMTYRSMLHAGSRGSGSSASRVYPPFFFPFPALSPSLPLSLGCMRALPPTRLHVNERRE